MSTEAQSPPKERAPSPLVPIIAGILGGSLLSTLLSIWFTDYVTQTEEAVRSRHTWKERSYAELLAPVNVQLQRTKNAFNRWHGKNLHLENQVIKSSNHTIRDLLLSRAHLLPPELLENAGKLIEHYDTWLEEFELQRVTKKPDEASDYVFVGPKGFGFPTVAETHFQEKYRQYGKELYGNN